MFVRVSRKEQGLHFTVVDIQQDDKDQELELILDLGIVQRCDLNGMQSWVVIAESLITSDLSDDEKAFLARDLANWLPPLSFEGLLKAREDDIKQLAALSPEKASIKPAIPATLPETDPLTIIAGWLASQESE